MSAPTPPLKFLIVEDEPLLALDIAAIVEDEGHEVLGEASCLREVQALALEPAPDVVFVDLHLAEQSSGLDVCRHVLNRWSHAVVMFITGNARKLPPDLAGGHALLPKPYSRGSLSAATRFLAEGIRNPPPTSPPPVDLSFTPKLRRTWEPAE